MSDAKTAKQTLLPPLPDPRALNSQRHGILSEHVPAWERDGYAVHVQAVRESIRADNYLEKRLADRAALALWRLDRVARWEASEMEADARRFQDRLQTDDPMASLRASYGSPEAPAAARGLRDTLRSLAKLTGESERVLLDDPETVELVAVDRDLEAGAWATISGDGNLESIPQQARECVGVDLIMDAQEKWNIAPERVARVMLDRRATKDEVQNVLDWDWQVTADELVGLVSECKRAAGSDWSWYLTRKRIDAESAARDLRVMGSRLRLLVAHGFAQATEPDGKRLEKVARYEAHLERVLYRSLGELRQLRTAASELPVAQDVSGHLSAVN